jgi:hypothetical protein
VQFFGKGWRSAKQREIGYAFLHWIHEDGIGTGR